MHRLEIINLCKRYTFCSGSHRFSGTCTVMAYGPRSGKPTVLCLMGRSE